MSEQQNQSSKIDSIKRRLSNPVLEVQTATLKEALDFGDAGLEVVLQALQTGSRQLQRSAYRLLRKSQEPRVKQVLQNYKPWQRFERLEEYLGYKGRHVSRFSDRSVIEFSPETSITDPVNTAYALRCEYDDAENLGCLLARLLQDPLAGKLEALVFGMWLEADESTSSSQLIDALVAAKDKLTSLKAVFIGDISAEECEISWIRQSDISPILMAYPQLEVLQVRGGEGLEFTPPVRHEKLNALIVETGGLSQTTVAQICNLNLPGLEHLELGFGSENYGGDCWVESVAPILTELRFPNLTYLGLKNSHFSDEIAEAVVRSPLLESISVLDLSMGTLSDEGAEKLIKCAAISQLDILNVSKNFLSPAMIQKLEHLAATIEQYPNLGSEVTVQVLADRQKDLEEDSYLHGRYCSVAE